MKKRIFSILAVLLLVVTTLGGCMAPKETAQKEDSNEPAAAEESADGAKIALITDIGTIDDKSFNQGSWEGVVKYAEEVGISHKYYKPTEQSDEAYMNSMELAIKGGAETVVLPGFLFEVAVYNMQQKYPDVNFILIDGAPRPAANKPESIASNTLSIYYAEEQAGYLAGYAAVKDGYKNLGFMGGVALPAVIKYGYGFVQGADEAAKELGVDGVNIKYTYVGNFAATPENETKASSWFTSGTEVIFACGGAVGNSVMKAAEKIGDKAVIGVDVDQYSESATVITSAMKNLQQSVYDALKSIEDGTFKGGQSVVLGADTGNIMISMDNAKFKTFTKQDYDKVYQAIRSGEIKIGKDDIAASADEIPVEKVAVEVVK